MLPELLLIIFGFLLGSVSSAIIVCYILHLPDPRIEGSHNPGATNVLRIGDKKAAAITLFADMFKGIIAVTSAKLFGLSFLMETLVALATVLGHIYPIWFGFKGGKGVATFLGALWVLHPAVGFLSSLTWIVTAKFVQISSLSALATIVFTPVYFYYFSRVPESTYVICLISLCIFWTHRENIRRLIHGKERKI